MDHWTAPDFLSVDSADDYLASLSSFLQDDPKATTNQFANVTPLALGGFVGGGGGSTLADASSPELTSDSASPSSSDGNANTSMSASVADGHYSANNKARGRRSSPTRNVYTTVSASAHHGTPEPKRKNGAGTAGAIKDNRRTSDSGAGHHSHATVDDGVTARSESPDDGFDGKGDKGKTSERRKAQNRQAQRNFRERKEKHLKDLEERVVSLEQQTKDQDAENAALKQLLENLQSENARLKVYESAFTFDYDKDVSGSSAMSQSTAFRAPASGASSPSEALGTSQSSNSFRFDAGQSGNSTMSSVSSSTVDSPVLFASTSSPDVKPSPTAVDNAVSSSAAEGSDSVFLSSFVNPSPSPFIGFSNLPVASPEALSGDVFKTYRDPLASLGMPSADLSTFADLDALLAGPSSNDGLPAGSAALSPATEETLAAFLNPSPPGAVALGGDRSLSSSLHGSPRPLTSAATSVPPSATPSYASDFALGHLGPAGSPPCPSGVHVSAETLAKIKGQFDPNGKFEFDLDGLCSEMKLKATCQEAARQALQQAMREDAAASRQAYPSAQL
ncbi:hypothetical protein JCM10908_006358 [Rhodotorula pacifica]|uniref:uncharacterized protein n=1 Tax=Rhodotorula pacifica TaxID=1495444 RepID=UPI00317D7484